MAQKLVWRAAMSQDFGNDFMTITDENGQEFNLEHLATAEVDEQLYMAFLPADLDEDHEDYGVVILKVVEDNDEFLLEALNDEALQERVFDVITEMLSNDDDDDDYE